MNHPVHSCVVPTYGRSPYLEACLESLAAQTSGAATIVVTSTPFEGLDRLCAGVGARLMLHGPNRGIGADWNAALVSATTPLVTIAHQDDVYDPEFSSAVIRAHRRYPDSALFFTDADEITEAGSARPDGTNNRVKRMLVQLAFAGRQSIRDGLARRLLLGLGNPVTCPAVTINRRAVPAFRFREDLRTNMDWLAWLELSSCGPITRIPHRLMSHRVHTTSETARCLDDGSRSREDAMVFEQLWPRPVAALLERVYRRSYQGYL